MTTRPCKECANDSAVYDMNLHCCRVRYVLWLVPGVRQRVVDGIRARYGSESAKALVKELREDYGISLEGGD